MLSNAEPSGFGRRPGRPLWLLVALGTLLLAVGVAVAALGWLMLQYPRLRGPGRGRVVQLELGRAVALEQVATELAALGAIDHPQWFVWHARLRGADSRLREGTILLYDNMTRREVLQRIAHGYGSAQLRIVLPEGATRFDIATRLSRWGVCTKETFLAASADPALLRELDIRGSSAEGLLFPDTYLLQENMDGAVLVRRFVANGRRRLSELFLQYPAELERLETEFRWTSGEIITLASIVEREAAAKSEQPMIAGVFLNRLRDPGFKPKRLQADPTVAYGCLVDAPRVPSCAEFDGLRVSRAMLLDASNPYNTYRLDGLPPGPIANPGLAAVRAVLVPVQHEFFYFVAKGGGLHQFSRSLADHNAAIEQQRVHVGIAPDQGGAP